MSRVSRDDVVQIMKFYLTDNGGFGRDLLSFQRREGQSLLLPCRLWPLPITPQFVPLSMQKIRELKFQAKRIGTQRGIQGMIKKCPRYPGREELKSSPVLGSDAMASRDGKN